MKLNKIYNNKANTLILLCCSTLLYFSCKPKNEAPNTTTTSTKPEEAQISKLKENVSNYGNEVDFMKKHTPIIEIMDTTGFSKVAVSPYLQGRVMTSSSKGDAGQSYGWINRALFTSKDTLDHINAYGGEERFWLGPEGGQYALFFKKGQDFNLENWQTPRLMDLDRFEVKVATYKSVVFTKKASLTNYAGYTFDLGIERKIEVVAPTMVFSKLGMEKIEGVHSVAYRTTNTLTNLGSTAWKKDTGLLSIWLLGMFNPSPATSIIFPFKKGDVDSLGKPVIDDYFGKVPAARLVVKDDVLFFSGDGKFRSKIGLTPQRAKNVCGAYDATSQTLTIVTYNKPEGVTDYVNSQWKIQDKPYAGDVINSYNDGAPAPGEKPLGPFFELETSSPALALKPNQSGTHIQMTCHFEGTPQQLTQISEQLLGVSLAEVTSALNTK